MIFMSDGLLTVSDWIKNEQKRRYFNAYFLVLYFVVACLALYLGNGALLFLGLVVGMFQAMTNVIFLAGKKPLDADDSDIMKAYGTGPYWFKKLIDKLKAQD
jgi:hypothetical protein